MNFRRPVEKQTWVHLENFYKLPSNFPTYKIWAK